MRDWWREWWFVVACLLLVLALTGICTAIAAACERRGGVLMETAHGAQCLKAVPP